MKNNYLLIDYGNSYIKAAIYDGNKIIEEQQVKKTKSASSLLSKFHLLKKHHPNKIIEAATSTTKYVEPFNSGLIKQLNAKPKVVSRKDFTGLIDFSNLDKKMLIGADILCDTAYINKTIKCGCAFSFGTVYFGIFVKNKQLRSAYLLPSITKGMKFIAQNTMIPSKDLPDIFGKQNGLNTFDAFSAGGNLAIEGFVDNIVKHNKVNSKNVLLSGGDCFKFKNTTNKYQVKHNIVLLGLIELIKFRKW